MNDNNAPHYTELPIAQLEENKGQIAGLPANPRNIQPDKLAKLKRSILDNPEMLQLRGILVYPHGDKYIVIGGNMRLRAMVELGMTSSPCVVIPSHVTADKLRAYTILDNSSMGEWDWQALQLEWDTAQLDDWGIDPMEEEEYNVKAETMGEDFDEIKKEIIPLSVDFVMPPFSVLNTRTKEWQDRKNSWKSHWNEAPVGRGENLTYNRTAQSPAFYDVKNDLRGQLKREPTTDEVIAECEKRGVGMLSGTSMFDPVVCELMYRWFNVGGGRILDPFAGGAVRGLVAGALGMPYFGNDLRPEQVDANRETLKQFKMETNPAPTWTIGDSRNIDSILQEQGEDAPFDMIFSCPPYADLEKYSDSPDDLSNMEYEDFLAAYQEIITKSCALLKDNRFAVFVVGEVRDPRGIYRGFVQDTIRAFQQAGLQYYNELILVTQVSSAAMRARMLMTNRKPSRVHQTCLAMYKGIIDTHEVALVGYKGDAPSRDLRKDFHPLKNSRIEL